MDRCGRDCFGSGQSGRLREAALMYAGVVALAITLSGAAPFSTQLTSCGSMSNLLVAGPPLQWFIPGTTNMRAKPCALPPMALFIALCRAERLRTRISQSSYALRARNLKEKFAQQGVEVVGSKPEEFGPFIFAESARWGALARAVGAKLD